MFFNTKFLIKGFKSDNLYLKLFEVRTFCCVKIIEWAYEEAQKVCGTRKYYDKRRDREVKSKLIRFLREPNENKRN